MKLTELLQEIGDDNIRFNFAPAILTGGEIKQRKGYVEAKVGIAGIGVIDLVANEPENMVMLVILPGAKVREIHAKEKAVRELAKRDGAAVTCPTCHNISTADKDGLSKCCSAQVWDDYFYYNQPKP
jgi:hypothetical protein